MNYENLWETVGIKINASENLVILAVPSYGNRKRWEGEMEFRLSPAQLNELTEHVEGQKTKERMREVAAAELTEFLEDMKAKYHDKKATLAEQLSLTLEELPKAVWWTLEDASQPVAMNSNQD